MALESIGLGISIGDTGRPVEDDEINEPPVVITPEVAATATPPASASPPPAKRSRRKAPVLGVDPLVEMSRVEERPVPQYRVSFQSSMGILEVSYHNVVVSDAVVCLMYDKRDKWSTFYRPPVSIDPIKVVINDVTYDVISLDITTRLDLGKVPYTMLLLIRKDFLFSHIDGAKRGYPSKPAPAISSAPEPSSIDPSVVMGKVPPERIPSQMFDVGIPSGPTFAPSFINEDQ